MAFHVACNGAALETLCIYVPGTGPWFAELRFVDGAAAVLQGKVTINVGEREFKAFIPVTHDGTFGERRCVEAWGGTGGWQKATKARSYRNDAGVKARDVAEDLAREVGETLGSFNGPGALGSHWLREARIAQSSLEAALGTVPWWVSYDGATHIGARAASTPAAGSYQVLHAWPDRNYVKLAVDDVFAVGIGSILSERLPAPLTVRSLEIVITPDELRMLCYTFDDARTSKLADALRLIASKGEEKIFGTYRYRVSELDGDRVHLQIVRAASGLPDALSVPMWPGIAGTHATLTKSAEVLVSFIDGLRSDPAIVGFAGKGGTGFTPTKLQLGGDGPKARAAYQGATVKVLTPPAVFQGTINGLPAVGAVVWPTAFTLGTIEVGTEKVEVAT